MQINSIQKINIPKVKFTGNFPSSLQQNYQRMEGVDFMAYYDSQASLNIAMMNISKVDEKTSEQKPEYKNELKTMINNNQAVIMALIPRMLGAKDVNNDRRINPSLGIGEKPGTFLSCIEKLDEIRDLGVNTLHILPIHPPGKTSAMGTAGSVYAPENM